MKNKKYLNNLGEFKVRLFYRGVVSEVRSENIKNNSKFFKDYKNYLTFKKLPQQYKNIVESKLVRPHYISVTNNSEKLGVYEIHISPQKTPNGIINKSVIKSYVVYDKVKNVVRYSQKSDVNNLLNVLINSGLLKNTPYEWLQQARDSMDSCSSNHFTNMFTKNEDYIKSIGELLYGVGGFSSILSNKNILKAIFIGTITSTKELKKRYMSQIGLKNIGFDSLVKAVSCIKDKNDAFNDKTSFSSLLGTKITVSTKSNYYSTIRSISTSGYNMAQSIPFIANLLKSSTNPERDYKNILHFLLFDHSFDLINECQTLNQKINLGWSHKRLAEIHTKFSKIITEVQALFEENVTIQYPEDPFNELNSNFKLITSSSEYLKEGTEMSHCLYSNNYFTKSTEKRCFILTYTGNVRGTAEISLMGYQNTLPLNRDEKTFFVERVNEHGEKVYFKFSVNQFRGVRNAMLSEEINKELTDLLCNPLTHQWISDLIDTTLTTTSKSALNWLDIINKTKEAEIQEQRLIEIEF